MRRFRYLQSTYPKAAMLSWCAEWGGCRQAMGARFPQANNWSLWQIPSLQ